MVMASWLWNLRFQAFPIFSIMGTQHIINHAGFWNSVLPAYLEALYNFLLKKPPRLIIANSAEHFSEVLKIHHVFIVLPIGFVELSASHFIVLLSECDMPVSLQTSLQRLKNRVQFTLQAILKKPKNMEKFETFHNKMANLSEKFLLKRKKLIRFYAA